MPGWSAAWRQAKPHPRSRNSQVWSEGNQASPEARPEERKVHGQAISDTARHARSTAHRKAAALHRRDPRSPLRTGHRAWRDEEEGCCW